MKLNNCTDCGSSAEDDWGRVHEYMCRGGFQDYTINCSSRETCHKELVVTVNDATPDYDLAYESLVNCWNMLNPKEDTCD